MTTLFVAHDGGAQAAQDPAAREALIRTEDARGNGPRGLTPILDALRNPALRGQAIRALGRLERPELVGQVLPFLFIPELRATAAEAAAQSLRGLTSRTVRSEAEGALLDSVFGLLRDRARAETRHDVVGLLARSLARLPFTDSRQARAAEGVLIALAAPETGSAEVLARVDGVAHGLYTLVRARRTLGEPSPAAVEWLRRAAVFAPHAGAAAPLRRVAWLALHASGVTTGFPVAAGLADSDPQVRRLALQAIPFVTDTGPRRALLVRASQDPEAMVRRDWVTLHRTVFPTDCAPLLRATEDRSPGVALTAIDVLNGPCANRTEVVATLRRYIDAGPTGVSARAANGVSWHRRAHALVTLARVEPRAAAPLLWNDTRHPVWQVRMYVARGAALIRDTAVLSRLAFDTVGSVREVAITGLAASVGHLADQVYVRALSSPDYHVVLAAARALKGAPVVDSVLPAVLAALERLHRERRQTSRDPRLELLARVEEMGGGQTAASQLELLLEDVDTEVITRVLAVLGRQGASPDREAVVASQRDTTPIPSGPVRVRVVMSLSTGGGSFDVLLDTENAPVTVARVAALIRERYYDGLMFHRVVPNFVLQGGSPGMNEYVGIGPFMRDELSPAHHARGTLGISTRGRDTGDAQWFINMVDNYRLDHEYTVFARVVAGMDVVDRILEGDVMESVRIVQ
ncbi:MAG TPA: peptidylprolyl isomerase [Gemmatimonadaceae bacterium]